MATSLAAAEPDTNQTIESILGESSVAGAQTQLNAGEFVTAAALAERRVEEVEAESNRYHPDLAEPLIILGDARLALGDAQGAVDAYERALHVTRVNNGLHAPAQVEIVYREAEAYLDLKDFEKSNQRREYAYGILRRSHADRSEIIPAVSRLAAWYTRTNHIYQARVMYERALRLAETHLEPGDPMYVELLLQFARTYRRQLFQGGARAPFSPGVKSSTRPAFTYHTLNFLAPAENALDAADEMTRSLGPDRRADRVRVLIDVGDWNLLFREYGRARAAYREAWQILEQTDRAALAETFAQPVPLHVPTLGNPDRPPFEYRGESRRGRIEMAFDITDTGTVRRLYTMSMDPSEITDIPFLRAMRRARFRPSLIDGELADTPDNRHVHDFVYYVDLKPR